MTDRDRAFQTVLDRVKGIGGGLMAVDGRCGSGKTSLAQWLGERLDCPVFHTDHFYLPFEERRPGWRQTPGGNMDFPRLLAQVIEPFQRGEPVAYRPYDCMAGKWGGETVFPACPAAILEGSYSCHPGLGEGYALRIFVTCGKETQLRRLTAREGERA